MSVGDGNKSKTIIHLRFLGHLPLQRSPCKPKIEVFGSEWLRDHKGLMSQWVLTLGSILVPLWKHSTSQLTSSGVEKMELNSRQCLGNHVWCYSAVLVLNKSINLICWFLSKSCTQNTFFCLQHNKTYTFFRPLGGVNVPIHGVEENLERFHSASANHLLVWIHPVAFSHVAAKWWQIARGNQGHQYQIDNTSHLSTPAPNTTSASTSHPHHLQWKKYRYR